LEYDPDTGRWARDLVPSLAANVPGMSDGLLDLDNFTRYGTKDGTLKLATSEGTKTYANLGGLPRPGDDHAFCRFYDPKRNRVMYYGGPKDKPQQLFALDLETEKPKWAELGVKVAGNGKLPLSSREVVYIPKHDVFLLLAGQSPTVANVDVWVLDPRENAFTRVDPPGAPPERFVAQGLQYDPVTDLCFYIAAQNGPPSMRAFRYAP
ncbi:MAG: hypothetical protein WED34_11915, partial [Planctomycetales bacterium]